MTTDELLNPASTILLIDWPTREVPDTLAQAGHTVVASEGPGPEDYEPDDAAYGYREYSARDNEGGLWSFMKPLD